MIRAYLRVLVVFLALAVVGDRAPAAAERSPSGTPYFAGQLLVATPRLTDPHFSHTVIQLIAHNSDGAMGLIINRVYGEGHLANLLAGFGIEDAETDALIRLHDGGPVDKRRGFVLHTDDYTGPSTMPVAPGLALSTGPDVLEAMAAGTGPSRVLFALGYAGWGPGQLEGEMAREDWFTAPADTNLIFGVPEDAMWERAIATAGQAL